MKVRELKTQKAEKTLIDTEVVLLLELKKKLSLAEGKGAAAAGSANDKKSGESHLMFSE